ncbi:MAG TPA: glycosyltransferase [Roseiarcus sp.]|nr:glycosyltransferase [Roseiarcus sp.]
MEGLFAEWGSGARAAPLRALRPRRVERPLAPQGPPPFAPEIAFLALYGGAPSTLRAATEIAARCGVSADEALLNEGLTRDEVFYGLFANHIHAPFFTGEIPVAETVDPAAAIRKGIAPLAPNDLGLTHLIAPRGGAIRLLLDAARAGRLPTKFAIASPRRFGACVREAAASRIAEAGAHALKNGDAALSAHARLSVGQIMIGAIFALSAPFLWILNPNLLIAACSVALWACFVASIALRAATIAANRSTGSAPPLSGKDLPIYSLIVPLNKEAAVLDRLILALDAIDYPRAKLDIKIVVEADDTETLMELARRRLPARYDIIVAPPGAPRTKPRALNIALPFLRGQHVVIYDAEDAPDPGQLRLAAARFAAAPGVDCLQARLLVENAKDSWITNGIMAQPPQESSTPPPYLLGHERQRQQICAGGPQRAAGRSRRAIPRLRAPHPLSPRMPCPSRRDVEAVRSRRNAGRHKGQATV